MSVAWREWGPEAFQLARDQDKPVLLDIGAVWCHWCHVMDEGIPGHPIHTGAYSDPAIVDLINARYVAIKVDTDRRPDINARYNMGGWPSTVFLTPDGEPIYGETYVPPGRMASLLRYIADYYRDKREDVRAQIAQHAREEAAASKEQAESPAPVDAPRRTADRIADAYDETYGGFGSEPKFPQTDALRLALSRGVLGGRDQARIVENTLIQMAAGGMYDRHAGGFFRYSTTRDWSIPHYEKMLEDNAQLSDLCFRAGYLLKNDRLTEIGLDVHRWMFSTLRDHVSGCFAGSQDADREEEYYGKTLAERSLMPAPYIDRTLYLGWNASTVSSMATRYRALGDAAVLEQARQAYAFLLEHIAPFHYRAEGEARGACNLLADLGPLLAASIDLAETTGEGEYVAEAERLAATILDELAEPDGAFRDAPCDPAAIGALAKPVHDLGENSHAAHALIRLAALTGTGRYREAAAKALESFAGSYERWSYLGASYACAVQSSLFPQMRVVLAGDSDDAAYRELRRCAWLAPEQPVVLSGPQEDGVYPPGPGAAPRAYVCVDVVCLPPASQPQELAERLRSAGAMHPGSA